jgi:hypothetical protein
MNDIDIYRQVLFTLPYGLIDSHGDVHRHGMMLLPVEPINPQDILENSSDSGLEKLSQVVKRLGSLSVVTTDHLRRLVERDEIYLREVYRLASQISQGPLTTTTASYKAQFMRAFLGNVVIL